MVRCVKGKGRPPALACPLLTDPCSHPPNGKEAPASVGHEGRQAGGLTPSVNQIAPAHFLLQHKAGAISLPGPEGPSVGLFHVVNYLVFHHWHSYVSCVSVPLVEDLVNHS